MTQILFFILTAAHAHVLTPSYQEGKRIANESKGQVTQQMNSSGVQAFIKDSQGKGRTPQQGELDKPTDSPISSFLLDVYGERQHFELHPQTDPLFGRGKNALNVVDGNLHVHSDNTYTLHHCQERKLPAVVECEIHKDVRIRKRMVTITKKGSFAFSGPENDWIFRQEKIGKDRVRYWTHDQDAIKNFIHRHRGVDPSRITSIRTELKGANGSHVEHPSNYKAYGFKPWGKRDWFFHGYKVHYSYTEEKEEKYPEVLTRNGCASVMSLTAQGYYQLHSKECLDSQNPRVYDDISVSQSCWREKRIYHAIKRVKGNCNPLRERGCEQMESKCVGDVYKQTYRCRRAGGRLNPINTSNQRPFCLTGDCETMVDFDDMDFDQAIAQMAVLDELRKYVGQIHIFSGQSKACKTTKFKKCCFKKSGIAIKMGLSKCSSGERELAQLRGKGLCVYVGSKAIKKLRVKIGKREVYCCFPSKLLRVFQEQGRAQLGMGWGTAKHAECRGLTLQEIQRIDFSRMDLSEAFDEIQQRVKEINVPGAQRQLKQRLQQMKRAIQ